MCRRYRHKPGSDRPCARGGSAGGGIRPAGPWCARPATGACPAAARNPRPGGPAGRRSPVAGASCTGVTDLTAHGHGLPHPRQDPPRSAQAAALGTGPRIGKTVVRIGSPGPPDDRPNGMGTEAHSRHSGQYERSARLWGSHTETRFGVQEYESTGSRAETCPFHYSLPTPPPPSESQKRPYAFFPDTLIPALLSWPHQGTTPPRLTPGPLLFCSSHKNISEEAVCSHSGHFPALPSPSAAFPTHSHTPPIGDLYQRPHLSGQTLLSRCAHHRRDRRTRCGAGDGLQESPPNPDSSHARTHPTAWGRTPPAYSRPVGVRLPRSPGRYPVGAECRG